MTPRGPSRRRFTEMLGFRLGFVLSMALLPVGLLAVLQARSLMTEARARSERAMVEAEAEAPWAVATGEVQRSRLELAAEA